MHSFDDLRGVTEAIIQHENGQMPYSEAQIAKALTLAGVEAPKKAFLATPQILGSALAGAATVAQPVVDGIQKQLEPLVGYSDKLKTLFVVVSLIGIVVVAIAKYDERRKGIS